MVVLGIEPDQLLVKKLPFFDFASVFETYENRIKMTNYFFHIRGSKQKVVVVPPPKTTTFWRRPLGECVPLNAFKLNKTNQLQILDNWSLLNSFTSKKSTRNAEYSVFLLLFLCAYSLQIVKIQKKNKNEIRQSIKKSSQPNSGENKKTVLLFLMNSLALSIHQEGPHQG